MPEWISYDSALAESADKRRHLLLGNGFSMGVHPRFSYRTLYAEAVRVDRSIKPLFDGHGTNFEDALRSTHNSEDQTKIRRALIGAISDVHPKRKYLTPDQADACGILLETFAGRTRGCLRGRVFTTNYDMFVYWVLMRFKSELDLYDGHDNYGLWNDGVLKKTSVFYLHGALHLYTRRVGNVRPEIQTWKFMYQDGYPIPAQVRDSIANGRLHLFVSEGESWQKRQRIRNNRYLRKANEQFGKACDDESAAVFTIGHSLNDVDQHITDLIGVGSATVFIGVHRPSDDGAQAMKVARRWARARRDSGRPPLEIFLFDSSECSIWGAPAQQPILTLKVRL